MTTGVGVRAWVGMYDVEAVLGHVARAVDDVALEPEVEARGPRVGHRVPDAGEGVERAVHRADVERRRDGAEVLTQRGSHGDEDNAGGGSAPRGAAGGSRGSPPGRASLTVKNEPRASRVVN